MRKITLFFAALLISMTAFAVNITDGTKLYLKPNANWNADGARFAAYFFGGDGELWVSMTDTDNDGVYEVTCSGTREKVIFCRMNGGNSTNGWGNKWNQTADLTWDGTKNQYNVPDGAWDNSGNDYWVEFGNNTEIEVHLCKTEYKWGSLNNNWLSNINTAIYLPMAADKAETLNKKVMENNKVLLSFNVCPIEGRERNSWGETDYIINFEVVSAKLIDIDTLEDIGEVEIAYLW